MNSGILDVLKPPGMTSHDVVDWVRSLLPTGAKVGHAGTLDPAAAGVLVVCVGAATRLTEYLMDCNKAYRAEICLGVTTDSLDADGRVLQERDASGVTEADVRSALARLVGPQMMEPPMYSAARVGGRRLYHLAREGRQVQRPPRPVTLHALDLIRFTPGRRATLLADLHCTKGTFVRVVAGQVGELLGVGAHLSFLVRTSVGTHLLAHCATLEELGAAAKGGTLAQLCVPVERALAHLPEQRLTGAALRAFRQGSPTACGGEGLGLVRVHGPEGRLIGIGEVVGHSGEWILQPRKVLPDL